jgi:predicted nuclease of predicted toxin-antitoxin system
MLKGRTFIYQFLNSPNFKYLANENVPFSSITYLKSKGYDIKAIGVDDPSITDEQVMRIAIDENRTIITYDSDYGELIFKH